MRSPRRFAFGLAIALLMKVAEAGGWFAVEHAFGLAVLAPRLESPFLALVAVNLASMGGSTPGNLGGYEAAALPRVLGLRASPHDLALAARGTRHLCYLLPMAGCGYLLLSVRGMRGSLRRG